MLDKDYIKYLQKYDNKVPYIEYKDKVKCFLGIVLKINGVNYFAPLTSYKMKFDKLKNDIDFYKIEDKNKIYSTIALNNMVPVIKNKYYELTYDNLEKFRNFNSKRDKNKYWKLLQYELELLDKKFIIKSAKKLYKECNNNPQSKISQRCCNFKLLEEKSNEYLKNN